MFNPTKEQVYNLNLVQTQKRIKIVAGAGTGKSSSLRYMARELPEKNFLVLCFNSANAKESNEHPDRPTNIFYSTVHSLAYKQIVNKGMKDKLGSYLNFNDLAGLGLEKIIKREDLVVVRRTILDMVTLFCRSDSRNIEEFSLKRLPYYFYISKNSSNYTNHELNPVQLEQVSKSVRLYWELLVDSGHKSKITHDVYLKIFDLHEYKVDIFIDKTTYLKVKIDSIVLDEAQDSNPVTESIFSRQTQLQQVMVGDPMQQLYSWRGAGKAMDNFRQCYIGKLTESFRFNSTIAEQANKVLANGGSDMVLTGSSTKETIETIAYLCRSNTGVVEQLLPFIGTTIKVYVSINMKDVYSKLIHIASCRANKAPYWPNKDFINIINKKTLDDALQHSEELDRYIKLGRELSKFGSIKDIREALDSVIVDNPKKAAVVISTGHASKGLEYDRVIIGDDFLPIKKNSKKYFMDSIVEEMWDKEDLVCLLYVMITRARVELILPWYLKNKL